MSIYQSNTYRSEICWLADYGGRFGWHFISAGSCNHHLKNQFSSYAQIFTPKDMLKYLHPSPQVKQIRKRSRVTTFYNSLAIYILKSYSRDGSRAAATSKMECFVIIVNGWKPLNIITKYSILDVAAALGLPLLQSLYSATYEWTYHQYHIKRSV